MGFHLLAETPDAVPYAWVVAIISPLCAVIVFLAWLLIGAWRREEKRSDALATIVNSFVPVPNHKEP